MNLIDYLISRSKGASSKLAVAEIATGRTITYQELWDRVHKFSYQFSINGILPGDCVALAMPNNIDWIVCFLACLKYGAVVLPIRQTLSPHEAKSLLSRTKPALFIGDSSFINRSLPFDLLDDEQLVVVFTKKVLKKDRSRKRMVKLSEFMNSPESSERQPSIDPSKTATIVYTYRGYGYPVGAVMDHTNYVEGIKSYIETGELTSNHVFLSLLPYAYTYPLLGCLLAPLATGSKIIIHDGKLSGKLWEAIAENGIDVLTGVPSFYSILLKSIKSTHQKSQITHAFCGGSKMPIDLFREFENACGISLRQGYGLTETLPVSCNPSTGNRPESLGKILTGSSKPIAARIVDSAGIPVKMGEVGEIAVSGPTVMREYFQMARETKDTLKNGWFHTGDLGRMDASGYLFFEGLKKRIAKVGGNIVDLAEVEYRILCNLGVKHARAFSVQDERWGEIISAEIDVADDSFDMTSLKRYLKYYLASYKVPKNIKVQS